MWNLPGASAFAQPNMAAKSSWSLGGIKEWLCPLKKDVHMQEKFYAVFTVRPIPVSVQEVLMQ